jgi:hypothetical protein
VIGTAILDELDRPRQRKTLPHMSWDECTAGLLDLYRTVVRDAGRADASDWSVGAPATGSVRAQS